MKKLFFFCMMSMGAMLAHAQEAIEIAGTAFVAELDLVKQTATIVDYNYKIDDSKYCINKNRKFKNVNSGKIRKVEIPSEVESMGVHYPITTIGRAAFAGFRNVDYVVIPSTVTTIEDYAFFSTSLLGVEVPASVTTIGDRAFGQCKNLRSLKLPNAVALGNNVYAESEGLKPSYYQPQEQQLLAAGNSGGGAAQQQLPALLEKKESTVATVPSDVDTGLPIAQPANDKTFAFIIANEDYTKVAKVACAKNDGRMFQIYCHQVMGLPTENIFYKENATYADILELLDLTKDIVSVCGEEARVIFYYAGHGIPENTGKDAYLLPIDASGTNTSAAFRLSELYNRLGALSAQNVTVFMDACFSGATRDGAMVSEARGVAIKVPPLHPQGNMVVFAAAQDNQTAHQYTEKGHGLFTYFLLKKLKETRGTVNYGELATYLQKEVGLKSLLVNKKKQSPSVMGSAKLGNAWKNMTLK